MLSNEQIAEYLTNIATVYEINHKSRFQIIAYKNAADTIISYPEPIYTLWQANPSSLDSIPNIGSSIMEKINYLLKNGKPHPTAKKEFSTVHPAVFVFTKINGIGPINAHKLTKTLKFSQKPQTALEELVKYAQNHVVSKLETFGEKSESSILANTLSFLGRKSRMSYPIAKKLADKIIVYLHQQFPKIEFKALGSLRRQSETVGDIDIAAAAKDPKPILEHFLKYPANLQTIANGTNKATIRLFDDIHVDLMIKPPQSFGALLQHFTGSRQHNIILRKYAQKKGYSLSEYGIKDIITGKIHRFETEESFYDFLGLKYIPPIERTGENELEAYQK